MAEFRLTNIAVEDLAEIWDYSYGVWSERQEDKYYELMIGACESIAESPEAGRKYHEISEEIPGFKTGKHSIFYRELRPKEIEVVRILHASMDLKSKMGE